MAIIKCKMCGGDLIITEGSTVAECEYCSTLQTIPSLDDERKLTLFSRANRLRAACEFDKAAGIYESIVTDFPEEAEAYWGLVLCRYGIEYVDDPTSGKKIPTCHRSSFQCVPEDPDFAQVLENADIYSRRIYREEAHTIEQLRKGIISISSKEQPYDIFICYKETDFSGARSLDSVLAQDIYDALTDKGYRVFFSRITLEDKLGQEYEPYIFSALNSAKVMLVVGTDYEHFQAVWVKNEWSRFLKLMEQDRSRSLIPCYKGIDAYDMPKEFLRLQGQDLGKLGAIQDLLRGIGKLIPRDTAPAAAAEQVIAPAPAAGGTVANLLRRAQMALEDEEYAAAAEFCEQVLNMDAVNGEAYLYKFMAAARISSRDTITADPELLLTPKTAAKDAGRAIQFASGSLKQWVNDLLVKSRLQREQREEEARQKQEQEFLRQMKLREEERRRAAEAEEARRQEEIARQEMLVQRKKFESLQGMLSAGYHWAFSACTKLDGTVLVADKPKSKACLAMNWKNIAAVDVSNYCMTAMTKDGTLLSQGVSWLNLDPCKYPWTDLAAYSKGDDFTLALHKDGTVSYSCNEYNDMAPFLQKTSGWQDITAISAGQTHAVGLRSDGTVVAVGKNKHGECDVSGWNRVIAVSAGSEFTVGLRADGSVYVTGNDVWGQCKLLGWRDIVAISAGIDHTLGLKSDGTVLIAGGATKELKEAAYQRGIVAISAGYETCLLLRESGTVAVIGKLKNGKSNIEGENLFDCLPAQEREEFVQNIVQIRNQYLTRR